MVFSHFRHRLGGGNSRSFEFTQSLFYSRILTATEVNIACSGHHKIAVDAFTFNVLFCGIQVCDFEISDFRPCSESILSGNLRGMKVWIRFDVAT
jgi:hypothetical protein